MRINILGNGGVQREQSQSTISFPIKELLMVGISKPETARFPITPCARWSVRVLAFKIAEVGQETLCGFYNISNGFMLNLEM